MTGWPLEDPAPDTDMVSDVLFGEWLQTLEPLVVFYDLERGVKGREAARLAYLRRAQLTSLYRKNLRTGPSTGDQGKGTQ